MRPLRLIFWETTRACNLECPHCRASAIKTRLPEELTTQEAKRFIDSAASFSKPILVFSGGEALLREDVFELIEYASGFIHIAAPLQDPIGRPSWPDTTLIKNSKPPRRPKPP